MTHTQLEVSVYLYSQITPRGIYVRPGEAIGSRETNFAGLGVEFTVLFSVLEDPTEGSSNYSHVFKPENPLPGIP